MARHRLSRCVLLIVSIGLRSSVATGGTCCADCLDQADPLHSVVAYNPLVFEQCSAASGICCYGCSFSHGALASQDGVALDGNGAAQVAAGQQFSFRFNNVSRVTYDFLKANQAQTSFVGNESAEASVTQGVFTICSSYAGRIALRGWGTDSCTQVTDEYKIAVVEGNGTATCDSSASAVVAASASSAHNEPVDATGRDTTDSRSTDEDFGSCSATRGTVVTRADGSKVCECTGDWRNPPACDAFSYLKVVLTILGAVATVISILLSVYLYIKSRNKKTPQDDTAKDEQEDRSDDDDEMLSVECSKLPTDTPAFQSARPSFIAGNTLATASKETTL